MSSTGTTVHFDSNVELIRFEPASLPTESPAEQVVLIEQGFKDLVLDLSFIAVQKKKTTGGLQGHLFAADLILNQHYHTALQDLLRVLNPSPTSLVTIHFESSTQSSSYTLGERSGELFRRLLDNSEVLEENWILTDILQALAPYQPSPDSSVNLNQEGSPFSDSSFFSTESLHLDAADQFLSEAVQGIVLSPEHSVISLSESDSPLTSSETLGTTDSDESLHSVHSIPAHTASRPPTPPVLPRLSFPNPAIVNWIDGYPISADRPYLEGSYSDFISAFLNDRRAYTICIGIVKDQQRQVSKDIKYFEQVLPVATRQANKNTTRLARVSSSNGLYDLQYLREHWITLNLTHLRSLRAILNEIWQRHHHAVRLNKKGILTPDTLSASVENALWWQRPRLPLEFSFHSSNYPWF